MVQAKNLRQRCVEFQNYNIISGLQTFIEYPYVIGNKLYIVMKLEHNILINVSIV